ncbi:MAG: glutamyl-tRNA reductase [Candidatus Dormibacteraeota bacterium]|nr:glutamyl-tRNA reductase [Candidatus Dormibacteraeota bacterium]
MPFLATGISHHLAPLPVREQLHLDDAQVVESLGAIVAHAGLSGAVCLSTCNRTEFYLSTRDERASRLATSRFFHYVAPTPEFSELVFSHAGADGLRHVIRVASGLDSMILGESQVLAQFKRAHRLALEAGTMDGELDLVMRRAVETAKLVRSTTGISRQAVGFGQVALQAAQSRLGDLRGQGAVILGGGSVGGAAARLLRRAGVDPLMVVRRGPRATALAEALSAELVEIGDLPALAPRFRVVVCSTTSESRVLSRETVAAIRRSQAPGGRLLILDLAVPRDVEPEAADLTGVELLDIDHLGDVVAANLGSRERHRPRAERVVEAAVTQLVEELEGRGAAPLIAALVDRAEVVRQGELRRAISRMGVVSELERAQLERLTQAIAAKLMHQPITFLRQHADDPQRRRVLEEAFGLAPAEADAEV